MIKTPVSAIKGLLAKVGLKVAIVGTGHEDYQRGFITDPEGVSIGRMTIYRGFYDHIKWYWNPMRYGPHEELRDVDYYGLAAELVLSHNIVLTKADFQQMARAAKVKQQADLQKRLGARKLLPTHSAQGNKIKRKGITGKNIRCFMSLDDAGITIPCEQETKVQERENEC